MNKAGNLLRRVSWLIRRSSRTTDVHLTISTTGNLLRRVSWLIRRSSRTTDVRFISLFSEKDVTDSFVSISNFIPKSETNGTVLCVTVTEKQVWKIVQYQLDSFSSRSVWSRLSKIIHSRRQPTMNRKLSWIKKRKLGEREPVILNDALTHLQMIQACHKYHSLRKWAENSWQVWNSIDVCQFCHPHTFTDESYSRIILVRKKAQIFPTLALNKGIQGVPGEGVWFITWVLCLNATKQTTHQRKYICFIWRNFNQKLLLSHSFTCIHVYLSLLAMIAL